MFLCLDLGNVLFEIDREPFKKSLAPFCKSPQRFIDDTDALIDTGLLTLEQAIRMYRCLPPHDDASSFLGPWCAALKPNFRMMSWVRGLKLAGIKIAILSNIGIDHAAFVKKTWPELFEGCRLHLSCEVGVRKPSKLYFQSFVQKNKPWKSAVYLDDKPENCSIGQEYGLRSLNFKLEEFINKSNEEQSKELNNILSSVKQK